LAGIIDGKVFAAELRARVANVVSGLKSSHGLVPGLAVVLVGEDPASEVYVRNKGKQTVEVGMASFEHRLPDKTTEGDLLALIEQLNGDPAVHGILVQLPLPAQIDAHAVINASIQTRMLTDFTWSMSDDWRLVSLDWSPVRRWAV